MRKIHYVIAAVAVSYFCLIGAAMSADFDAKVTNVDGSPLKGDDGKEVSLTAAVACVNALTAPYADEQNLSGEEKVSRFVLAQRILNKDPTLSTITSEDVAKLKKLVNKFYPSPIVVSQVWAALERPASAPAHKSDKETSKKE